MDINLLAKRQLDRNEHKKMLVNNLGIFELRALGRELGVQSPTTKKRDELIELILDKIYNSSDSVVRLTKKGRPFKKLSNLDDILSQMTGESDADSFVNINRPLRYEDIICFSQEVPIFSEVKEEKIEARGVLRDTPVIAYFLDIRTGRKVFVNRKDVEKYNLQSGDFIEAVAKKINNNNHFLLTEINSINFVDAKKYVPSETQEASAIISNDKLFYGLLNLFCGRRNLILTHSELFESENFANFCAECQSKDYTLITLSLNTAFENQILFSQISSMINLTTSYGTGYDEGLNKVIDAIALTERLFGEGKKCVLFVNDIIAMLNTLDLCFADSPKQSGHKSKAIVVAQKLISLGKACSNGASVTVVMTYRDIDKDDQFLKDELERVCAKFEEK